MHGCALNSVLIIPMLNKKGLMNLKSFTVEQMVLLMNLKSSPGVSLSIIHTGADDSINESEIRKV